MDFFEKFRQGHIYLTFKGYFFPFKLNLKFHPKAKYPLLFVSKRTGRAQTRFSITTLRCFKTIAKFNHNHYNYDKRKNDWFCTFFHISVMINKHWWISHLQMAYYNHESLLITTTSLCALTHFVAPVNVFYLNTLFHSFVNVGVNMFFLWRETE